VTSTLFPKWTNVIISRSTRPSTARKKHGRTAKGRHLLKDSSKLILSHVIIFSVWTGKDVNTACRLYIVTYITHTHTQF